MDSTRSRWVLACLMVLTVAAGAIILTDSGRSPAAARRSQEFQRLVGGLGFGPAIDLSRCAFAFDPRIGQVCNSQLTPIPGGGFVCPYHACSVFENPSSVVNWQPWAEDVPDATVP